MNTAVVNTIALVLVIIGALNWGLIGGFHYNLVETLFGVGTITQVVYIVVGVAALFVGYTTFVAKK